MKPDVVIRLNAGIYRIVSTYGDANAQVEADVTVEAGKLSEATVSHSAARVTFKLVAREGGEALPDTQWTVQTADGEVVKRSVGALPDSHHGTRQLYSHRQVRYARVQARLHGCRRRGDAGRGTDALSAHRRPSLKSR